MSETWRGDCPQTRFPCRTQHKQFSSTSACVAVSSRHSHTLVMPFHSCEANAASPQSKQTATPIALAPALNFIATRGYNVKVNRCQGINLQPYHGTVPMYHGIHVQ